MKVARSRAPTQAVPTAQAMKVNPQTTSPTRLAHVDLNYSNPFFMYAFLSKYGMFRLFMPRIFGVFFPT